MRDSEPAGGRGRLRELVVLPGNNGYEGFRGLHVAIFSENYRIHRRYEMSTRRKEYYSAWIDRGTKSMEPSRASIQRDRAVDDIYHAIACLQPLCNPNVFASLDNEVVFPRLWIRLSLLLE